MEIGLLGHGVVGSGVCRIIDGAATEGLQNLHVKRILVKDETEMTDPRTTLKINEILSDPQISVIVECMGGLEPAHAYVRQALAAGKSVVTSNKKMLAVFYEDLMAAAKSSGARLLYEASVGGGIPWIDGLRRIRRIERIEMFRGIFNGTTNYILTRMGEEQAEFADVLQDAQKLGYAERDPADDIDGQDVRYKCCLSCAAAFDTAVQPSDVTVYGIRQIQARDIAYAASRHCRVKLIGTGIDRGSVLSVFALPVFLKQTDLLSLVPLNENGLETMSRTLGRAGFIGQGAGSLPTAHAVVQDMLDLAAGQAAAPVTLQHRPVDNQLHQGIYYVRTRRISCFRTVVDTEIDGEAFLSRQVSLAEIDELARSAADPSLFLAEVQDA